MKQLKTWQADLLLLFVAFIWGSTFLLVKNALQEITPVAFLAIRFLAAFLFLYIICRPGQKLLRKPVLKAGFLIGLFLFGGYAFQTIGLMFTSAVNAGFITGLSVILVPFFSIFLTKKAPNRYVVSGALSAAAGLAFLTLGPGLTLMIGDILVFCCACCFALHIVLVGHYAGSLDPTHLAIVQILTVGLISAVIAFLSPGESLPAVWNKNVIAALAVTSILATAMAFLIQNNVQRYTSPARTAIILSMEPVFAALTAYIFGNEPLTVQSLVGAALVLGGILLAEIKGNHGDQAETNANTPLSAPDGSQP